MKQQEFIDVLKNYVGVDPTEENAEALVEDLYNVNREKLSWRSLETIAAEFLELDGKNRYTEIIDTNGDRMITVKRPEDVHTGPEERTVIYPKEDVKVWLVGYKDSDTLYCPTSMDDENNESILEIDLDEDGDIMNQCYGVQPNSKRPESRRVYEPENSEEDMCESWMVGFLEEKQALHRKQILSLRYPNIEIYPAFIPVDSPYFKIVESWGGETDEVAIYQLVC